jgi:hypothetical protein
VAAFLAVRPDPVVVDDATVAAALDLHPRTVQRAIATLGRMGALECPPSKSGPVRHVGGSHPRELHVNRSHWVWAAAEAVSA